MPEDKSPLPKFDETAPFRPLKRLFFSTIFIIPEVPSGSYFADGLATISTRSIEPAGNASNKVLPFPPLSELGRPLIKIITEPSPLSVTPPSSSTSTDGNRFKTSFAVPPLTEMS